MTVIKVENISKLYRLGEVGTGSLAHDINRWWHRIRGKEDPYSQVGEENDRTKASTNDWVWALKEINFEVSQGQVLGVIGRNGAGKSTLLKILSRVTAPSSGQVKVKGRIASLLEVGTGFHPELTGRENLYLNGAILGMRRREIDGKLDEIVDFSGCARYLDTPVKRYSSGMQVRLAFAVAAFLEPEILIVDEVLAVGDAEFQKKCIGRMSEVAGEGRTVLFVSHNLGAVRRLCTSGMILRHGVSSGIQPLDDALNDYAMESERSGTVVDTQTLPRLSRWGTHARVIEFSCLNPPPQYGAPMEIEVKITCREEFQEAVVSIGFTAMDGNRVLTLDSDVTSPELKLLKGLNSVRFTLPFNPLHPAPYSIGCSLWKGGLILDGISPVAVWDVHSSANDRFSHRGFGACRPVAEVTHSTLL